MRDSRRSYPHFLSEYAPNFRQLARPPPPNGCATGSAGRSTWPQPTACELGFGIFAPALPLFLRSSLSSSLRKISSRANSSWHFVALALPAIEAAHGLLAVNELRELVSLWIRPGPPDPFLHTFSCSASLVCPSPLHNFAPWLYLYFFRIISSQFYTFLVPRLLPHSVFLSSLFQSLPFPLLP